MTLFRPLRSKYGEQSAPAEARLCTSIDGLIAEMRTIQLDMRTTKLQIVGLGHDVSALNAYRLALEARSWMQLGRRRADRVAAGVARARTARRDARGRYVS
jgi:hypothetical protein